MVAAGAVLAALTALGAGRAVGQDTPEVPEEGTPRLECAPGDEGVANLSSEFPALSDDSPYVRCAVFVSIGENYDYISHCYVAGNYDTQVLGPECSAGLNSISEDERIEQGLTGEEVRAPARPGLFSYVSERLDAIGRGFTDGWAEQKLRYSDAPDAWKLQVYSGGELIGQPREIWNGNPAERPISGWGSAAVTARGRTVVTRTPRPDPGDLYSSIGETNPVPYEPGQFLEATVLVTPYASLRSPIFVPFEDSCGAGPQTVTVYVTHGYGQAGDTATTVTVPHTARYEGDRFYHPDTRNRCPLQVEHDRTSERIKWRITPMPRGVTLGIDPPTLTTAETLQNPPPWPDHNIVRSTTEFGESVWDWHYDIPQGQDGRTLCLKMWDRNRKEVLNTGSVQGDQCVAGVVRTLPENPTKPLTAQRWRRAVIWYRPGSTWQLDQVCAYSAFNCQNKRGTINLWGWPSDDSFLWKAPMIGDIRDAIPDANSAPPGPFLNKPVAEYRPPLYRIDGVDTRTLTPPYGADPPRQILVVGNLNTTVRVEFSDQLSSSHNFVCARVDEYNKFPSQANPWPGQTEVTKDSAVYGQKCRRFTIINKTFTAPLGTYPSIDITNTEADERLAQSATVAWLEAGFNNVWRFRTDDLKWDTVYVVRAVGCLQGTDSTCTRWDDRFGTGRQAWDHAAWAPFRTPPNHHERTPRNTP